MGRGLAPGGADRGLNAPSVEQRTCGPSSHLALETRAPAPTAPQHCSVRGFGSGV